MRTLGLTTVADGANEDVTEQQTDRTSISEGIGGAQKQTRPNDTCRRSGFALRSVQHVLPTANTDHSNVPVLQLAYQWGLSTHLQLLIGLSVIVDPVVFRMGCCLLGRRGSFLCKIRHCGGEEWKMTELELKR